MVVVLLGMELDDLSKQGSTEEWRRMGTVWET